ncbi:uncharacterized protein LOC106649063 [Trichogramma pretiosum]|uniref:uncharacterized protein LOC106649063 n=1 Tax=Trichogramma pretiosum TaxID=7493 RepID=UPI0006C9DC6A|nr:uncharacterized protein LOC106649063 [Trichogramma pretiosum]
MRFIAVIGFVGLVIATTMADDFLTRSLNDCVEADSWTSCLKREMLGYLDERLGTKTEARSLDSIDEALLSRYFKYFKSFEYGVDLPVFDARLKYRPARNLADLEVEFKNNEVATAQARGLLKKKLLLPVLLLLKLKLKALMPIFVAIIGLKAMKALVLSKLAILLVVGFIAFQFFKKGGMAAPMGVTMEPTPPVPAYGLPPISTTTSGYEPVNAWDGSGPYSRVWTPSSSGALESQNLAYNYYTGGSSSNSYNSPSSLASSSGSSSGSGLPASSLSSSSSTSSSGASSSF